MGTGIACGAAALIFWGDQRIKRRVEKEIASGENREYLKGFLLVRKYHNRGAMLGLGQKKSGLVTALAIAMTLAALLVFLLSLGQKGNLLLRGGLTLLLGGAFSNTYDRLKRGYVVDYFSFGAKRGKFRNIVFNVADFCIITGALTAALGAGR